MRLTADSWVSVVLSRDSSRPLPVQLADAIRDRIDSGVLLPGQALPATRSWADQLGVSRGTVITAFQQLVAEGYLVAERGSGTRVNEQLLDVHPQSSSHPVLRRRNQVEAASNRDDERQAASKRKAGYDLTPDQPSTRDLVTSSWRSAWREAAATAPMLRADVAGMWELRQALAEHVRQMRGVIRSPESIVVTAGAREGLALILRTLSFGRTSRGPLRVGVEEPGYPSLRRVATRLGATLVNLSVDELGLQTERLPQDPSLIPDVVIVTPSHQYPLGGSLPVTRRRELIEWAAKFDVTIIEDDYDSELRYVGQPLPALAALDYAGRVLTLGTFSKTVAPSLSAGFVLVPARLRESMRHVREDLGQPVSLIVQQALATYLNSGELRRHTARMRREYGQRRAQMLAVLRGIPQLRVYPMDGGLHTVVETDVDEAQVLDVCRQFGVIVQGLSTYWSGTSEGRSGIVLGYGHLDDDEFEQALGHLREALVAGEASGEPEQFDFDAFIAAKKS